MTIPITPIFDLEFIQGIPRDFVVTDWLDAEGKFVNLTNYTAHLSIRTKAGETAPLLLDLKSGVGSDDTHGIQVFAQQVICHFTVAQTEAMQPLPGMRPVRGSPSSAPVYKAGVYELRVTSPAGVPYPVIRGDVFITLGVVNDE